MNPGDRRPQRESVGERVYIMNLDVIINTIT